MGDAPFAEKYKGYPIHMAQFQLIRDIVGGELPEKPSMENCARAGLTDEIWKVLQECWATDPLRRPSAHDLLACGTLT